jgi:hypothetical protein
MNVKEAVKKAIEHVSDIFEPEQPQNIGLEEVVFNEDENAWEVTVGFSRPWDHPKSVIATQSLNPARQYKVVKIDNESGEAIAIKIREPSYA